MDEQIENRNSADDDLEVDLLDRHDSDGLVGFGRLERVDPNALKVTLRRSTFSGQDSVEIYAHGKPPPSRGEGEPEVEALLARVTAAELTTYPLVAAEHRYDFLQPKYDELTAISILAEKHAPWPLPDSVDAFDGLLEELPTGFGRHAKYGLGLKWEYRLIPEAVLEMVGVTQLIIEPGDGASIELPAFRLGVDRFTAIRKAIDAITSKAASRSLVARRLAAYNATLHAAMPAQFARRYPTVQPGEIYELIQLRSRSSTRASNRGSKDAAAAVQIVREDAKALASEEPAKLFELKAVLEQVTLAQLIGEFEAMLQKNLPEPKWQAFFKANPFILGLAFPHPVILIQGQANVGGTTIRGDGESVADFLMAQRFTGNLALVEIKRPSAKLVETKPYRGDIYAPHKDLTSSMAQVLDQRSQLLHHFASKKSQSEELKDTHVSYVTCIAIVGTVPTNLAQMRSLELFRHSSEVSVVTFDELLAKLKELHRLMSASDATVAAPQPADASNDVPF